MMDNRGYLTDPGEKGPKPQTQLGAEPKEPRRVALYARESTKVPGLGLEYQLEYLRAAAGRLGMEVALEASEIVSGFASRLPKRDALPEQSRQAGFDTVMVMRLDRFGRSPANMLRAWDALEEAGVGFMSLSEGIDYSLPSGKLMARQLAIAAEFEGNLINRRTSAGRNAAMSKGVKCGRKKLLSDDDERDIAMALMKKEPALQLAKLYGVSRFTIRRVKHLLETSPDCLIHGHPHLGQPEACLVSGAGSKAAAPKAASNKVNKRKKHLPKTSPGGLIHTHSHLGQPEAYLLQECSALPVARSETESAVMVCEIQDDQRGNRLDELPDELPAERGRAHPQKWYPVQVSRLSQLPIALHHDSHHQVPG
ncbi:MAG: recombinase family protein [Holophagales bacterium]|jgi:DNA invertase Pin-like site-specific DNA recombinase|nr:recombinase family protein [Holophagales bacterium]